MRPMSHLLASMSLQMILKPLLERQISMVKFLSLCSLIEKLSIFPTWDILRTESHILSCEKKTIIKLIADQTALDTLVIVGRRDEKASEIPYLNERVTQAQIAFQNPQTTADALENQAVYLYNVLKWEEGVQ